jgi:hypothetical protein
MDFISIPQYCHGLNNMTIDPKTKLGQVIRIQAFETGYYRTDLKMTQEEVDQWNIELGINPVVAKAMESASMFGWNTYLNVLESMEKLDDKQKS